jgi:hypothetical protein
MPSCKDRFTAQEVADVVAYLATLRCRREIHPDCCFACGGRCRARRGGTGAGHVRTIPSRRCGTAELAHLFRIVLRSAP